MLVFVSINSKICNILPIRTFYQLQSSLSSMENDFQLQIRDYKIELDSSLRKFLKATQVFGLATKCINLKTVVTCDLPSLFVHFLNSFSKITISTLTSVQIVQLRSAFCSIVAIISSSPWTHSSNKFTKDLKFSHLTLIPMHSLLTLSGRAFTEKANSDKKRYDGNLLD